MSDVHPQRPPIRLTTAVAAVALLVAACGGGATPPPSAAPSPSPSPTVTATPTDGVREPAPSPTASASPPPPSPTPAASTPPDLATIAIELESLVEGLDRPVGFAPAADGSGRLFVIEQRGTIRVVRDGALERGLFLDLRDRISSGGERGLLGIAVHPDFPDDARLFVNYTDRSGDTVIAEFRVPDPAAGPADAASERVLLRFDQPFANHNGGALAFGPDGTLYIATGDGGAGGDPQDHGERLDTLLGKILRIGVDPSGARPYGIPADNPFASRSGARAEIAHLGLRNPWRMAFDRATGDLWIGDVGQNRFEELDVARAGSLGLDFGWDRLEGRACFEPSSGCDRTGLTPPIVAYPREFGCSVVGGPVYRGQAIPELQGVAVYADVCSGFVFGALAAGPDEQEPVVLLESGRPIASLGEDETGELIAVDLGGGTLWRIVAAG